MNRPTVVSYSILELIPGRFEFDCLIAYDEGIVAVVAERDVWTRKLEIISLAELVLEAGEWRFEPISLAA